MVFRCKSPTVRAWRVQSGCWRCVYLLWHACKRDAIVISIRSALLLWAQWS
jgi:hypothetical protein